MTDDWFFVRMSSKRPLAYGSEKNFYVEGDIASIWPEYQHLVDKATFDNRGRAIVNVRWTVGQGGVVPMATMYKVIFLKRDKGDPEVSRRLSVEESMAYLEANNFCNPHQLVKDERKMRLRRDFFREFLRQCEVHIVNTVAPPLEVQEVVRGIACGKGSADKYPGTLRRVTAVVEVDGKDMEMTFITNNFAWSPRTIAELYRARWAIETFFKELKQTLQLADFVGYNEKAVKWQVWTGLLAHLLLRFLKHVAKWTLSFSRLVGTVRAAIWMKIDLLGALRLYGIAGGPQRLVIVEFQPYFQGFERFTSRPVG